MTQLGIKTTGGKSVFYNELTGIVIVRGTPADREIGGAAIETLGGVQLRVYSGVGGGGGFGAVNGVTLGPVRQF